MIEWKGNKSLGILVRAGTRAKVLADSSRGTVAPHFIFKLILAVCTVQRSMFNTCQQAFQNVDRGGLKTLNQ